MMGWYLAIKDIRDFCRADKRIFNRLLLGMIVCSFVMNFAYSFARYRGDLFSVNIGERVPLYRIENPQMIEMEQVSCILNELENETDIPEVVSVSCIANGPKGMRVAGSTELTSKNAKLTGSWEEGYALPISKDETKACAVNRTYLDYGERLKMTGQTFELNGEEYVIRGVYESLTGAADIVIYLQEFQKEYQSCNAFWIIFEENLNAKQMSCFVNIVKNYVEHGSIKEPDLTGGMGTMVTLSHMFQYSIFLVLLVIFLASIMQYWYEVNRPTYAVYWITGAKMRSILGVVFCETLLLSVGSYVIGFLLWLTVRQFVLGRMRLEMVDLVLGFALFYGTLSVLGICNMAHICRKFSAETALDEIG